ncbi:MAG: hypothetical protein K6G22_00820 [Lachnospiraceae bacterium]|nr:hypothetical protein [Lachnospiraceae bacterium]
MSDKKNVISSIFIVILTVVLFIMVMALFFTTQPQKHGYYTVVPSHNMLYNIERGNYDSVLEDRYLNAGLGVDPEKNDAYEVPYAAADYYEAAFNYYGYAGAGESEAAAQYEYVMDLSRKKLGQYEYIADQIDAFLTRSEEEE